MDDETAAVIALGVERIAASVQRIAIALEIQVAHLRATSTPDNNERADRILALGLSSEDIDWPSE
jgi:hypothetical protein